LGWNRVKLNLPPWSVSAFAFNRIMKIKPLPPGTPIGKKGVGPLGGRPLGKSTVGVADPDEMEYRVLEVAKLLLDFARISAIKKTISEKYRISPRTVEGYITDARALIRKEEGGASKEDLRAMISVRYHEIILQTMATETSGGDIKMQLVALDQFARLHGLNAPDKVAATDANGSDVPLPQPLIANGPQSGLPYVPPKPLSLEDARAAMRLLKSELGIPSGVVIETPRKAPATPSPGQEMAIASQ